MMEPQTVIYFDGLCNLCSRSVQFVLKHDKKKLFYFASLQGQTGQQFLAKQHLHLSQFQTFILSQNGKLYFKSTAALKVMRDMGGLLSVLYVFIIVPPFIRNTVYNWVAANRYKWFGKRNVCWLPTPELMTRFLQ